MTREGFARLAFEAHYNDNHGEGGWEAWNTLGPREREPWLKVGRVVEECVTGALVENGVGGTVRDRQGVQFGDGNTQVNSFGTRW